MYSTEQALDRNFTSRETIVKYRLTFLHALQGHVPDVDELPLSLRLIAIAHGKRSLGTPMQRAQAQPMTPSSTATTMMTEDTASRPVRASRLRAHPTGLPPHLDLGESTPASVQQKSKARGTPAAAMSTAKSRLAGEAGRATRSTVLEGTVMEDAKARPSEEALESKVRREWRFGQALDGSVPHRQKYISGLKVI